MDTICFFGVAGLGLVIGLVIGRFREKAMTMSTFMTFVVGGTMGLVLVSNFTAPATSFIERSLAALAVSILVWGPFFLGATVGRYMRKH